MSLAAPIFAEMTLCNTTALMNQCLGSCIEAARYNEVRFVWFFIIGYLFYLVKDLIVASKAISPQRKTNLAFGLRLSFHLLMIAGITWYVWVYGL